MSWPLAIMVSIAMVVIGVTAALNRDVSAVAAAILTILIALGLAELREIKTNTNGNNNELMLRNKEATAQLLDRNREATAQLLEQNKALLAELTQYRLAAQEFTNRALESAPFPALGSSADTSTPQHEHEQQ